VHRSSVLARVGSLTGSVLIVLPVELGVGLRVSLAEIFVVLVLLVVLTVDVVPEALETVN
jgi:hypothetical protein